METMNATVCYFISVVATMWVTGHYILVPSLTQKDAALKVVSILGIVTVSIMSTMGMLSLQETIKIAPIITQVWMSYIGTVVSLTHLYSGRRVVYSTDISHRKRLHPYVARSVTMHQHAFWFAVWVIGVYIGYRLLS